MKLFQSIAASLVAFTASAADNSNIVLPPLDSKADLEEKMFVFIPGGNVATSYYVDTAKAIQEASDMKLWVVIPEILDKLCISVCPSDSTCFHLKSDVDKVIGMATDQGYAGPNTGEGVFMGGHSLGTTCADNLIRGYSYDYQAAVMMGGYVKDQKVEDYQIPVLTLGAELDGGLGRPGYLYNSVSASDEWAKNNGGINSQTHVTQKPVVILEGADHSDFCPGFQVPGDIFPSEITKDEAMSKIGEHVGAFLNIQVNNGPSEAFTTLQNGQTWTRDELLKPLVDAFETTGERNQVDDISAPWCEKAQKIISGVKSEDDLAKMDLISVYKTQDHPFEDTRTGYTKLDNDHVRFNVSGHDTFYGSLSFAQMCITPAQEIGCKMLSGDRVAEQLGLSADQYDADMTCGDVNKYAIEQAEQIMQSTTAGKKALERFKASGRPICIGEDFTAFGNIGPLFVKEHLEVKDDTKNNCLSVKALREGPQSLTSLIFPGVHYCKLLSPARVVEYYMTDGLKSKSTCLNTDSSVSELLEQLTEFIQ